jgi:CheY-like chemotaxis protein
VLLVDALARLAAAALGGVGELDRAEYVSLLRRRLAALEGGGPLPRRAPAERVLARRVMETIEGDWHDGDENLVRGRLDAWRRGPDASSDARAVLETARELVRIEPRPATIRFFLWAQESLAAGLDDALAGAPPLLESGPVQAHSRREVAMAKRILVVDDDENILSLERTILEQKGFHVTTAGGGEEALRLLREQAFDLVLLDVMMPDKDGFEVCRLIKQDPRTKAVPVIFLTARGGGEALAEGFESGAVMYINKPFTANKLLTIVNAMLGQAGG